MCKSDIEDLPHAFFYCSSNRVTGLALLGYLQKAVQNLSPEAALRLEFGEEHHETDQLALVCLRSTGLQYIWEARANKKVVSLFKMRSEIELKVSILRKTRHREAGDKMLELIS